PIAVTLPDPSSSDGVVSAFGDNAQYITYIGTQGMGLWIDDDGELSGNLTSFGPLKGYTVTTTQGFIFTYDLD
ncbi:MAG: hypothetical protein QGI45_05585, partial [Myxococcota bacterium]|nr:hypothetical protein [Myxococcota bacterium]